MRGQGAAAWWNGFGSKGEALAFAGGGALIMGLGVVRLFGQTSGELVLDAFAKEVASGQNKPAAFAKTEQALEDLAKSDRRYRNILFGFLEVVGVGY